MKTVYSLHRIEVKKNQRYPKRKLDWHFIGYYSSLEKVEKAVRRAVAQEKREERWREKEAKKEGERYVKSNPTFCYQAERVCLDTGTDMYALSLHIYTSEGKPENSCLWMNENDLGDWASFQGRLEETIKFKSGDIVEVRQGGFVELNIVYACPISCHKYEKDWKFRGLDLDVGDDCYMTYSLGIGDTHDHPIAISVFAPTKKVPVNLARKLRAKLIAEDFASLGGDVPIRWWPLMEPYIQDSKLLDEVLNDLERTVDKKNSSDISAFLFTKLDKAKAVLNFSKEQAERLDRIYAAALQVRKKEWEEKEKSNPY